MHAPANHRANSPMPAKLLSYDKSVVVTSLYEIYAVMTDNIYKPVFLRDPSGPNACTKKFEKFGFAAALKGISHNRFDKLEN